MLMTAPARQAYLDLLKTMLVLGMILAHVIQLVGVRVRPMPTANGICDFVNLITFSGFLFAFGIGLGLSGEQDRPLRERLRPAGKLLAATYVSSLAYVTLVEKRTLTADLLIDVLSLRVLCGWSEFLASFFMLYLLLAFARPVFLAIPKSPLLMLAAVAWCLAGSVLTTSVNLPLTATIIANTNYANFPLLPYLPWLLFGIRIGQDRGAIKLRYLPFVAAATGAFVWWRLESGEFPHRFPPSALWVVGSSAFLLVYLALAQAVTRHLSVPRACLLPGRHVLMFLLLSNLVIFTIRNRRGQPIHQLWDAVGMAALIIAGVGLVAFASEMWGKSRRQRRAGIAVELAR